MNVTILSDDELIGGCEARQPSRILEPELFMYYAELLKRFKQYKAFMKGPENFIAQAQQLSDKKIEPSYWCVLMDGTSTVGEWQEMEAYAHDKHQYATLRTVICNNCDGAQYKHGWYGCANGVFGFSETGRFAPLITFAQFRTLSTPQQL